MSFSVTVSLWPLGSGGGECWFSLLLLTCSLYLLPKHSGFVGPTRAKENLPGTITPDTQSLSGTTGQLKPLQVVPWEGLESKDS